MLTERKKIRIVATDKKYHEAPIFIVPKYDEQKKRLILGQEEWSEADKAELKQAEFVMDADTTIRVSHLMTLDLNQIVDRAQYEIIIRDKEIALDKKSINPGAHRYYIEDKEEEAVEVVTKTKRKKLAMDAIETWSLDEQVSNARVLGCFVSNLSKTQVEAWLYELADKTPDRIIEIAKDKNLKVKIFINKLIDKSIWYIDSGRYMCGKDLIGINLEYAIAFLQDKQNKTLVTQWGILISDKQPMSEPQNMPVE